MYGIVFIATLRPDHIPGAPPVLRCADGQSPPLSDIRRSVLRRRPDPPEVGEILIAEAEDQVA